MQYRDLPVFWRCTLVLPLFLQASETVRCLYTGGWSKLVNLFGITQVLGLTIFTALTWALLAKWGRLSRQKFVLSGALTLVMVDTLSYGSVIARLPLNFAATLLLHILAVVATAYVAFSYEKS
ncbi:hypothetical protein QPK87_10310 [Kamptonema cortianum]|nr:hypothetical protein [Geitlerinema splendidum]MDK3156969.1 hypothetical protein [Kamptonema cortianum]